MDEDERDYVVVRGETTARDDMGRLPEKPSTRTAEQQHVTARTATLVARKVAMVSALLVNVDLRNNDTHILFWFLCFFR